MANPKSDNAHQEYIDQNPFQGFKIDDTGILERIAGRHPCPKCGKSRKLFCYSCYVPIKPLQGMLPIVKLPIKIDIIKHKQEIDGKSTASHAALLAPQDVTIYTYPDIPDYSKEAVVLIFPGRDAISVSQLISCGDNLAQIREFQNQPLDNLPDGYHQCTLMKKIPKTREENGCFQKVNTLPITKAVFIDSTWHQCKSIYKDEKIRAIPCVVIQHRISQFWRHQKGSPRWYLATIEAIHQFLLELHLHCWGLNPNYVGIINCFTEKSGQLNSLHVESPEAYNGQYDNLLYLFRHMYDVIHSYYSHNDLYAYKRRLM